VLYTVIKIGRVKSNTTGGYFIANELYSHRVKVLCMNQEIEIKHLEASNSKIHYANKAP